MQDGGEIVLIGNESDILHSGYSHAISEGGKRYPSVNHYAHSQILLSLGIDETKLLDLLAVSTRDVPNKARDLLLENMPSGHDLNSLSSYLSTSRHSYTMQGLRIRVHQDKAFERCLMETAQCLLIVCDSRDKELGIGMEEQTFAEWINRERVDAEQISYWMMNEIGRPQNLGANQLGYFLMWLRHEIKDAKRAAMLKARCTEVEGITRDAHEKPVQMSVNDQVIALTGVFRPLSNYFSMRFTIKGDVYRSVEHYAYEKLFISLKLDDKCIEKLNTTVLPIHIPLVAQRVFEKQNIPQSTIDSKMSKLDRWRQSGMKHKLGNNDYLRQLLLSTGNALLVDFAEGDPAWTCGSSEAELQRLLAKDYVDARKLMGWMRDKEEKVPRNVRHINGNKTGVLLMELRERMASADNQSRIPLISHLDLSTLSSQVSTHVVAFTAESVWHPLYPAEITGAGGRILASPAHYVAEKAIKFYSLNRLDSEYIMEDKSSRVCWQRLHEVLRSASLDLEKDTQWWMVQRHAVMKEALSLMLEQHPPLLRALLDTHDALLVYCARFSSMEAELSIGMRESDLRAWLTHVDVDTKHLMELCNRPLAFRPPYLGGNRLGFILMELRREFVLRGVFPSTLPDLGIGADAILGSDSATESMLCDVEFDVIDEEGYTGLWINPLLLLAKETGDKELLAVATRTKAPPRMVSPDEEERITTIVDDIDAMGGKVRKGVSPPRPPQLADDVAALSPQQAAGGTTTATAAAAVAAMTDEMEVSSHEVQTEGGAAAAAVAAPTPPPPPLLQRTCRRPFATPVAPASPTRTQPQQPGAPATPRVIRVARRRGAQHTPVRQATAGPSSSSLTVVIDRRPPPTILDTPAPSDFRPLATSTPFQSAAAALPYYNRPDTPLGLLLAHSAQKKRRMAVEREDPRLAVRRRPAAAKSMDVVRKAVPKGMADERRNAPKTVDRTPAKSILAVPKGMADERRNATKRVQFTPAKSMDAVKKEVPKGMAEERRNAPKTVDRTPAKSKDVVQKGTAEERRNAPKTVDRNAATATDGQQNVAAADRRSGLVSVDSTTGTSKRGKVNGGIEERRQSLRVALKRSQEEDAVVETPEMKRLKLEAKKWFDENVTNAVGISAEVKLRRCRIVRAIMDRHGPL